MIGVSTRLWLAGLSAAGVVAAHGLAFFLAEPHLHQREVLLVETGHGAAWPWIVTLALSAFVASLVGFVLRRVRQPGMPIGRLAAPRLATLQVVGFLAIETTERLATHHGVLGMFEEPVVQIGLVAQVVVAIVAAALLSLFARVVDRLVVGRRRHRRRRSTSAAHPLITVALTPAVPGVASGGRGLRGPPLPA